AWVSAAASGARLERRAGPSRIVEGDEYPLELWPRTGRIPPPGGVLREPLLPRPVATRPLRPRPVRRALPIERRRRSPFGRTSWTLRDPLGLCARTHTAGERDEVLVLPRTEEVRFSGSAGGSRGSGLVGATAALAARPQGSVGDFEVDGLRP